MNVTLRLGVGLGSLILAVGGCVSTPSPRMSALLGVPVNAETMATQPVAKWPAQHRFAFMIVSDASGPEAAPAISASMLSRLAQRTQVYLEKYCELSGIVPIPIEATQTDQRLIALLEKAKQVDAESLIIALFSSTESTEAGTFGEERMMTQIPGETTHNTALLELGLVNVERGSMDIQVSGEARQSLDRLNVPIGADYPPYETALDILRANAGQQALDRALPIFTKGCVTP